MWSRSKEYVLAFDKTFNDRVAPVKGSGKVCSFYKKNYILVKPWKQASIWLSLSWWLHKLQNIPTHYIYSRVNMYNQSSFSCRIVKFQLRLFKFVFVLQVNVGLVAVVSCDTLCLSYTQKTKTVNCCAWLTKRDKKQKNAWICNYMKIRWDFGMLAKFLFTST